MNFRGEFHRNKHRRLQHRIDIAIGIAIVAILWTFVGWAIVRAVDKLPQIQSEDNFTNTLPQANEKESYTIQAIVTAYNTVPSQTDDDNCISASGDDICGRKDVVACDKSIRYGTPVRILGKVYICLDRMADRFHGNRFDISFDKDIAGAISFGIKKIDVRIYENAPVYGNTVSATR